MSWSDNRLPKYRKHRASGQAVVTLNGRDFYLGPHGTKTSKIEYDRLLGEWLASGRNPLCASSDELTVVELCARYFKFAKGHYQKDGNCTKVLPSLKCALRYLRERYGRQLAVEFGPLALKALREQMVQENLSRRYINDHVDKIKRMFKWAVAEQLLPAASYQALTAVEGLRKGRSAARETDPILPAGRFSTEPSNRVEETEREVQQADPAEQRFHLRPERPSPPIHARLPPMLLDHNLRLVSFGDAHSQTLLAVLLAARLRNVRWYAMSIQ
jgi:hypothetical protein